MLTEQLAALVAAAADDLQHQFDGTSSCALAKTGRSVAGRKAAEGRWAALREVQRGSDAGEPVLLVASDRLRHWTDDLDRHRARGSRADWLDYRAAGVATLRELLSSADPVLGGADGVRYAFEQVGTA